VDLELTPEQPSGVEEVIAALLDRAASPPPDRWWEAGLLDSLET
jgi:hypothetical protein